MVKILYGKGDSLVMVYMDTILTCFLHSLTCQSNLVVVLKHNTFSLNVYIAHLVLD